MNILNEVMVYGDLPFPEPMEAIEFQLELVRAGVKPCVLMPHYSAQINGKVFDGLMRYEHPRGIVITREDYKGIDDLLEEMTLAPGFALGYGVADKPNTGDSNMAIILEDDKCIELLAIAYRKDDFEKVDRMMSLYSSALKKYKTRTMKKVTSCDAVVANRIRYWARLYGVEVK